MARKRKLAPEPTNSNKKAGITPKPTDSTENAANRRIFPSRMTPKLLFNFITSPLSPQQITDIKSIGFGGLLSLKTNYVPGKLAHWLCSNLYVPKSSLMDEKLRITASDIYLTTGLPMGPIPIVESKVRENSQEHKDLISGWKKQFGEKVEDVTKTMIYDKLLTQVEGGDDFKRNFVVFVVATFLNGVTGIKPSLRILECLKDVSQIPHLNWCLYTLKNLLENVKEWKEDQDKGEPKAFKGPIIILIVIYLDRVCFKFRSEPRIFPLLSSWTTELIRKRISLELKEAKVFGRGSVDPSLDYPLPLMEAPKAAVVDEDKVTSIEEKTDALRDLVSSAGMFHISLDKLLSAINRAEVVLPNVSFVNKFSSLGVGLLTATRLVGDGEGNGNKIDQNQPEFAEVDNQQDKQPENPEVDNQQDKQPENPEVDNQKQPENPEVDNEQQPKVDMVDSEKRPAIELDDDPFFSRPNIVKILLKLDDVCHDISEVHHHRRRRRMIRMRSVSPGPVDSQGCPSFKLFSSQDFLSADAGPSHVVQTDFPELPVPSPVTFEDPFLGPEENSPMGKTTVCGLTSNDVEATTPVVPVVQASTNCKSKDVAILISPTVSPVTTPEQQILHSPESEEPIQTGRATRRNTQPSCWFRSPFVVRNVDILSSATQAEKDLADYVFADLDDSETLFTDDTYILSRSDLNTLITGEMVADDVVAVWCEVLNEQEKLRASDSPLRVFLSDRTFVDPRSFKYKDLSLIFVPVLSMTPFLFVVHLRSSTVEVVCPMPTVDYLPHIQNMEQLVQMRLGKRLPEVHGIKKFKYQFYVPKSNIGVGVDRGIYLMRHMETYKGKRAGYKSGLNDASCLKRLRLKYCYLIVTFKDNSDKERVCQASMELKKMICDEDFGREIPYTDKYLLDYVSTKRNPWEGIVETEWLQVTRAGLQTLLPGMFVMDMGLDAFGIMSTLNKDDRFYFPTNIMFVDPSGARNTIQDQYIKIHYMPTTAENVRWAFFPICSNKHWYACVSDFDCKRNYILDSNPNRRDDVRLKLARKVVNNVVDIMIKDARFQRLQSIKSFGYMAMPVPVQATPFDCGMFMISWIKELHDKEKWSDRHFLTNFEELREHVLMDLIRWDRNKRTEFA